MEAEQVQTPITPPPSPQALAIFPLLMAFLVLVLATLGLVTVHYVVFQLCRSDTSPGTPAAEADMTTTAAPSAGVDPKTLDSIPVYAYARGRAADALWSGQTECVVCLGEFEEREAVRVLPGCRHVFHAECVDAWLASRSTCPVCRASVVDLESPPVHVAEVGERWTTRFPARC